MNELVVPKSTEADARNRAVRTFWQGLGTDVLLAVSGGITLAVADPAFDWTAAYWTGVGLALGKTVIQTVASYVTRKVAPPAA